MFETIVLTNVIVFLGVINELQRRQSVVRERELLHLIVARHLPEYAQTVGLMAQGPKDKLKQTKLENELAMAAVELEKRQQPQGIPVS